MSTTSYHTTALPSGISIHYADAGDIARPPVILLHGFASSSFQYRNLIPLLADEYHVIAPDLPGFGHTTYPSTLEITFDVIANSVIELLDALKITHFAVYVFDYGAPTAWRIALRRPNAIRAIISQNGNAYDAGLGSWWDPLKGWWASGSNYGDIREAVRPALSIDSIKRQYTFGTPKDRMQAIDPNTWTLDYLLNVKGHEDLQLDLFYDYRTNLSLYPKIQSWFRNSQVPVLLPWGKNDEIFPPSGAEAYKADLPGAQVHLLDGGHFLLETHLQEVAILIQKFLSEIIW